MRLNIGITSITAPGCEFPALREPWSVKPHYNSDGVQSGGLLSCRDFIIDNPNNHFRNSKEFLSAALPVVEKLLQEELRTTSSLKYNMVSYPSLTTHTNTLQHPDVSPKHSGSPGPSSRPQHQGWTFTTLMV